MNEPEHFEVTNSCAFYRPDGKVRLHEAIRLVTEAIALTRERKIPRLLVNITGLTGFPSPNLADRYFILREWADAAKGSLRLALVARPEMIDPEKFGVTVAGNAGLTAEVFTSESEALIWLNEEATR
jgi:hypothetical protein